MKSLENFVETRNNAKSLSEQASKAKDASLSAWRELSDEDKKDAIKLFGQLNPWFVV